MKNYDYKDIMVTTYEHSPFMSLDREEATDFYIGKIKEYGGTVLEFGTATGLLTIPMARNDIKVDTVDISDEMIDHVKEKLSAESDHVRGNIEFHNVNMIDFEVSKSFDVAILPDNVLLAANKLSDQMKLLKVAHRHLSDGGCLVLDIFTPDLKLIADQEEYNWCKFSVPDQDGFYICHKYTRVIPLHQRLEIDFVHEEKTKENKISDKYYSSISFRYIYPTELRLMLKMAGFRVVESYGDFNHNKKSEYYGDQVIVAVKE